ncbi:MAG: dihydrolipoyl dehydrogenase [Bacteroidetes bacterium]|nr:dihydrolipoyl dehydrogenase [Bacteroidota bacterium]
MQNFDVTIIGSGPGGYVAAIRCAQLGFKTAIVERYKTLGGTCLNVGCIPSKALLDSSEHYYAATKSFKTHGIDIDGLKVNFPQMIGRKADVVDQNTKGIDFLMKKNKIEVLHGHGSFVDAHTISIKSEEGEEQIKTARTIIATGSKPADLPFARIDKDRVISSTEALSLEKQPESMIVIGGGVIGVELGSVYARLGTKVTIVEYLDSLIPTMDADLGKELGRSMKKMGVKVMVSHKVTNVESDGKSVKLTALDKREKEVSLEADYCLVAIGRKPYTSGLGLENVGISTDKQGRIEVNEKLETEIPGIYAIGDVIKGAMLAHKAEEEGVFVAEVMAGQRPHINYNLIPGVVYTWPEAAAVGQTEKQLKDAGIPHKKGTFQMRALGRSRASMDIEGIVKVLAHEETDEILGVHMIGARAADMIAEAVVAMEFRASAEDIARMSHAHPTYTEAIKEACLAATADRSLHS